jgi:gluconate 2-dehydrogenase gamma chain
VARITRRAVIGSAAIVPVAALTSPAQQNAEGVRRSASSVFSPAQMSTLEAFIDRLIPADETGPGAVDAGAQNYIDRQLSGYLAAEKTAFLAGLDDLDAYARRTLGRAFAELGPAQRDQILTAMEAGDAQGFQTARNFFNRVRRLTLEGTFGDPIYGGNKNGAGWDIIRYPGPRPSVGAEMQRLDQAPPPYRRSAYGAEPDHEH